MNRRVSVVVSVAPMIECGFPGGECEHESEDECEHESENECDHECEDE